MVYLIDYKVDYYAQVYFVDKQMNIINSSSSLGTWETQNLCVCTHVRVPPLGSHAD